jgi:hypothetical protein
VEAASFFEASAVHMASCCRTREIFMYGHVTASEFHGGCLKQGRATFFSKGPKQILWAGL